MDIKLLKKLNAILLFAGMLAFCLEAEGQPSTSGGGPPLPPGLTLEPKPPPIPIYYGHPPVTAIGERHIWQHVTNCALPPDYFIKMLGTNLPSAAWNTTIGQQLKVVPVKIESLNPDFLGNLAHTLQTNCIEAYFTVGGNIDQIDLTRDGQMQAVWLNETGWQKYRATLRAHGVLLPSKVTPQEQGDSLFFSEAWKTRPWGIEQRPSYALNTNQLRQLRIWNNQQK